MTPNPLGTPTPRNELHALLDAGLDRAPEYLDARTPHQGPEPAYANHLPMGLHALHALGADANTLRAFAARERAHLPARAPWPALDSDEAHWRQRLAQQGRDTVLREALPERWPHTGAVAFHGLIRTAHAWESGHDGELALALAWWRQRDPAPTPAAAPAPAHRELDLPAWLDALWGLPAPADGPRAWIDLRMRAWAATPGFQAIAPTLRLGPDTLPALALWALEAYARSGHFTLLHAATASRALRVLVPLAPSAFGTTGLRAFSVHLAAALLASGWRGQGGLPVPLTWPRLHEWAMRKSDTHAIKLTHAAWDGARRGLDDTLCRQAATRALVPSGA